MLVSSTVYGIEELLDQVYALLGGFGYEVWMSHKGTVPVYPDQTALASCIPRHREVRPLPLDHHATLRKRGFLMGNSALLIKSC